MNKNIFMIVIISVLVTMGLASSITVLIFNTPFAQNTVDYFSFAVALFLVIDGFYKIRRYRNEPYFPNHLMRHLRILIGVCIFTVHVMQYIYRI